ncbi:MAG: nucleotide exchange factor GrpE, partial [Thermotogota bacterium]|nr:nucleotide exchange factor GrpE [Thermotogota bacterium]
VEELEKENNALKNELKKIEKERDEFKEYSIHLRTKFEDYKNLVEKEKKQIKMSTKKMIIEKLLVPFEKLKLSLNYKDEPEFVSAVEMVYKDMLKVFDSLKLKFIVPQKGDQFDPFEHDVIDKFETKEVNEYCVYDVQSIGYKLEGEVIKPAKVIVAVKPKENAPSGVKEDAPNVVKEDAPCGDKEKVKDKNNPCDKKADSDEQTGEGIDSKEGDK